MERFIIRRNNDGEMVPELIEEKYDEEIETSKEDEIRVYTDGACTNNGKEYARAGYGIWFGKNDARNVSESYNGKQTNNIAELLAIIKALTILNDDIQQGKKVIIYSDSRYAIRCCTTYGEKCFKKGWKNPNSKNKPIPNLELVQTGYMYCKEHNNIEFKHIAAHTGKQDRDSIGNENADRLANLAIGVEVANKTNKEIYLNVPYKEKDEAKQLGAKWDSSKKKWYIKEANRNKNMMMGRWGE